MVPWRHGAMVVPLRAPAVAPRTKIPASIKRSKTLDALDALDARSACVRAFTHSPQRGVNSMHMQTRAQGELARGGCGAGFYTDRA